MCTVNNYVDVDASQRRRVLKCFNERAGKFVWFLLEKAFTFLKPFYASTFLFGNIQW